MVRVTADEHDEQVFDPVSRAEGDIVFTRVRHTATAVVFYMRFRQLTVPKQYLEFRSTIEGNNGSTVYAAIYARHGLPQGWDVAFHEQTGRDCAHSNHINYAGDSLWMRVARGCLKNPKYIRVQAHSVVVRQSPTENATYEDSPTSHGATKQDQLRTWTPWVVTD